MIRHLLPLALATLLVTGCTDRNDDAGKHDSTTAHNAPGDTGAMPVRRTDSTSPPSPVIPDSAGIRWDADSIPIRTPDGKPARYGVESGRVTMAYSGDAKGDRTVVWDGWGDRERRETFRQPNPEYKSTGFDHSVFITDGVDQSYVSFMQKKAQHRRTTEAERYLSSPDAANRSFGSVMVEAAGAQRLADTMFLGRRCRVISRTRGDMTTTLTMWRGIVLREEVRNQRQGVRFVLEATRIETNVPVPESTFTVPTDFPIEEK